MSQQLACLSYNTKNLGDDIQTLAAMELTGKPDYFVQREQPWLSAKEAPAKLLANGWFIQNPFALFLPKNLSPVYTSFSFAFERYLTPTAARYLKQFEPIGCRDLWTKQLLDSKQIKTYFSGCLTLALKRKNIPRSDTTVINIDPDYESAIPETIRKSATFVTNDTEIGFTSEDIFKKNRLVLQFYFKLNKAYQKHDSNNLVSVGQWFHQWNETSIPADAVNRRFEAAENLLRIYESAKLVITNRLHCALPCLAFGTPLVFLNKEVNDNRFKGFEPILKVHQPSDRNIHWTPDPIDIALFKKNITSRSLQHWEEK